MKTIPVFALSLLLTLPLVAQPVTPAAFTGSDGADLLIPIAGRTPGARGELFVTDVTLVNFGPETQRLELTWNPQGGTSMPQVEFLDLGARIAFTAEDIVGVFFGTMGVGAIRIRAIDATGNADMNAQIDAHARVWTRTTCTDLAGTVSQSVPAVRLGEWRQCSGAYMHGARQNGQFRSNYGIVNPSPFADSFRVIVSSETGRFEEVVTVPPFGTVHRPVPAGAGGELSIFVEAPSTCHVAPIEMNWRTYATTVDNQSGSGWTMVGIQPRMDVAVE
ncbi:MAG: hypothetical protein ACRD2J_08695 [Thermoanaerobaculia bacterium]